MLVVVVAVGIWYAVAGRSELSGVPTTTTTTAPRDPTTTTTTTVPPTTTTTTAPSGPITTVGTYQVGTSHLALVRTPGPAQRTLPTTIWYPETTGARPLLVFSQGFWEPVPAYGALLSDWASAGFVVVAPTYPDTDLPPAPQTQTAALKTSDSEDIVHHPADLAFVVQTALADAQQAGNVLSGRVDPNEVGLVGQSDGADVSLAAATNSSYFTPHVKAIASLSGAEIPTYLGGSYFTPKLPKVPLLAVQSATDVINLPACSVQLYDAAPGPKWYLQLRGITHLHAYTTPGAYQTTIAEVTTRFFDTELAHEPAAMASVASVANTGTTSISDLPTAPTPPGTCNQTV